MDLGDCFNLLTLPKFLGIAQAELQQCIAIIACLKPCEIIWRDAAALSDWIVGVACFYLRLLWPSPHATVVPSRFKVPVQTLAMNVVPWASVVGALQGRSGRPT